MDKKRANKKSFLEQLLCNHYWQNEFEFYEILPSEEDFNEGYCWFICSKCGKEKNDSSLELKRCKEALPELMATWEKYGIRK